MEVGRKTCRKCGRAKPADREHFNWSERDGLSARCKDCRRQSGKKHYVANKVVYFRHAETRRQDIAEFIRSLKHDKSCTGCKQPHPYWRMHFDHLGDKMINLSHPRVKRWSKERILAEVAKCELVCANCHRDRSHYREQEAENASA
jgi:hypothetical protein